MPASSSLAEGLLRLQQQILEMIARGADNDRTFDRLCLLVEGAVEASTCTIMRMDEDRGCLDVASAPSAPAELVAALRGLVPSASAGSCGAAAHTRQTVIADDTATDPHWQDLADLARKFSIRACWSIPLVGEHDLLLGTLAISRSVTGGPAEHERDVLRTAGHLARIALDREHNERARRQQASLLSAIVEDSEDPIFVKDSEGRYILMNSAEAKGLGAPRDELLGLTDREIHPDWVADQIIAADEQVMRTGRSMVFEHEFEIPNGGRRVFLIRRFPRFDAAGRALGVVGIARDITELRRAEAALQQRQKLEGLGLLAGGIAHDFNNILTTILGNATLISATSPADPTTDEAVEHIELAVQRGSELITQLLAYAGKADRVRCNASIRDLIDEVNTLVASSISRYAKITLDFEDDLPDVHVDPTQIRQVVMNLITNASDAVGDAPGRIVVTARRTSCTREELRTFLLGEDLTEGSYVSIEVSDTGCGMTPETCAKIFDPFYTTKREGRGLGLAAVLGIVRIHQGAIAVQSRPGQGTTFRLLLPVASSPQPGERSGTTARSAIAEATLLVADDEEPVLELINRILAPTRARILTARDGQEALDIYRRHRHEITGVVLDVTLPRVAGDEVFREIRKIDPTTPVLLISGHGPESIARLIAGQQAAGFIEKPFVPKELVAAVEMMMQA